MFADGCATGVGRSVDTVVVRSSLPDPCRLARDRSTPDLASFASGVGSMRIASVIDVPECDLPVAVECRADDSESVVTGVGSSCVISRN